MKNKIISRLKVYLMCSVALLTVFSATFSFAKEYTFSWGANGGQVEGYKLYYKESGAASAPFNGLIANEGSSPIDIGNKTSFTISGLAEDETYHFTITAYLGSNESDFATVITVFADSVTTASYVEQSASGADTSDADTESTASNAETTASGADTISHEDEKLIRFRLAFPVILNFLLLSDS
jgi:Fibronectin type III domain